MAQKKGRRRGRNAALSGLVALIIIGVIVFFVYRHYAGQTTAQTTYTTAAAQTMTLTASVSGSGNVSLSSASAVTPQVSGTVSGLSIAVGDTVKKGQTLFTLVNPQLVEDVQNAQNAYDKAELGVSQAQLGVKQAELSYDQTLENYEDQSTSTTAASTPTTAHPTSTTEHPTSTTLSPPSISAISPKGGPAGTPVTITGEKLDEISNVMFGGAVATGLSVVNSTTITCIVPPGTGTVAVIGIVSGGTQVISPIDWVYGTTIITSASATLIDPVELIAATSTGGSTGSSLTYLDVKAAKQAITNAQLGVTSAQLQLDSAGLTLQNAKTAAAERTVIAPIAGTVTALNIVNGDTVGSSGQVSGASSSSGTSSSSSSSDVMDITNLNSFDVIVSLAETDVTSVKVGQQAVLTFDALPNLTLTGKVTEVDASGTNAQGVVSYNVTVTPDVTDSSVKGGMTCTANIITAVATDVLAVPNAAVKTATDGSSYVQVLKNNTPTDVTVEVGLATSSYTQITSGLTAGQEVITAAHTPSAGGTTTTTRSRTGSGGLTGGGGFGGGAPGGF